MRVSKNLRKFLVPWPFNGPSDQFTLRTTKRRRRRPEVAAICLITLLAIHTSTGEAKDELVTYSVVDNMIPVSLTDHPGDPKRGRAIAAGRDGNCLACHRMPIPEEQFHGDLGPDLIGVGSRFNEGELRIRLVDSKHVNPATIMPAFYKVSDLRRVARRYLDQPILGAQEIEDVVAYLKTLTRPNP